MNNDGVDVTRPENRRTDLNEATRVLPAFSSSRLRLARSSRGMSQTELANRMTERGVTTRGPSVSQIEAGRTRPSAGALAAMSNILEHPVSFFAGPTDELPHEADQLVHWRRLTTTPARERGRAGAFARYIQLFLAGTANYNVDLPALNLPSVPLGENDDVSIAVQAASKTRGHLGLGDGPMSTVVGAAEKAGVVAVRAPQGEFDRRIDAFAITDCNPPIMILGIEKDDWDRSRFDAAHELGHVVMHRHLVNSTNGQRWQEAQAHAFAAEFLMPAERIVAELPSQFDVGQFLALKQKWGVSIQALVRRSRDLEQLSHSRYVSAAKRMSSWGWRTANGEPGVRRPLEEPTVLKAIVKELDAARNLHPLLEDLGLPQGFLAQISAHSDER